MNIAALDIPEIRTNIAQYLDKTSLVACAQVCRIWQPTFEPLIWSEILIATDDAPGRRPDHKGLARNAHLTTHLIVVGCNLVEYLLVEVEADATNTQAESSNNNYTAMTTEIKSTTLPTGPASKPIQPRPQPPRRNGRFCNLQRLSISNSRNELMLPGYWEAIVALLRQNPSLSQFKIASVDPPPPPLLWQTIHGLTTPLRRLFLIRITIPPDQADLFWHACTNTTGLALVHCSLSPITTQQQQQQYPILPQLRRLVISGVRTIPSTELMKIFVTNCPNLEELHWNSNFGCAFPTKLFVDHLESRQQLQKHPSQMWRSLTQLRIPHAALKEDQIVKTLDSLVDLESLSILFDYRPVEPLSSVEHHSSSMDIMSHSDSNNNYHLQSIPIYQPRHQHHSHHNVQCQNPEVRLHTHNRILLSLERHFHTLRDLKFSVPYCDKTSSIVLQGALASCPNLVSISGEVIRGIEIAMGEPWVCSGLTSFYLDIDVAPWANGVYPSSLSSSREVPSKCRAEDDHYCNYKPSFTPAKIPKSQSWPPSCKNPAVSRVLSRNEIQKRVLAQFARLRSLQNLTLMGYHTTSSRILTSTSNNSHRRSVELDLRHGLDVLGSLSQLRSVYFTTTQNMEIEDALWIAQHWVQLSNLTSRLHPDPIQNQGLWEICLRKS